MSDPYSSSPKSSSILGPTLRFKGELSAEEDLLIQGQVEGSIKHTASLTVGKQGEVKADINARHITVEGKVQGDLHGSKAVTISATADVRGNIFSPTVSLIEGAKFKGSIDMDGSKAAQTGAAAPAAEPPARPVPKQSKASAG
jgi:cytoskeletal protein CcmA (bactofilin family)